jgi:flavorubredoxin
MKKLLVLYYSRSGNTEKMAKALAEGAQSVGDVTVELSYHVDASDLPSYDAIAIGAPTYRKEMPVDFKNLFDEAAQKGIALTGKLASTFGSYGWSGEAPKMVQDILIEQFGMQAVGEPLLAKYIPDQVALDASKDLGKKIAETLMSTT